MGLFCHSTGKHIGHIGWQSLGEFNVLSLILVTSSQSVTYHGGISWV